SGEAPEEDGEHEPPYQHGRRIRALATRRLGRQEITREEERRAGGGYQPGSVHSPETPVGLTDQYRAGQRDRRGRPRQSAGRSGSLLPGVPSDPGQRRQDEQQNRRRVLQRDRHADGE